MSNDTSDDETGLQPPRVFVSTTSHSRSNSCTLLRSPISPSSSVSSSVVFGQIPEEVLRAWGQLPEAIRLDPSLAVFQREYDRIAETRSLDNVRRDCLVVNMSLGTQPVVPSSTQNQTNVDEDGQDVQTQEKQRPFCRYMKLIVLSCCWLLFTTILMFKNERAETMHQVSVSSRESKNYQINERVTSKLISVTMEGPLLPLVKNKEYLPANLSTHYLMVWLQLLADGETTSWLSSTELDNLKLQNVSDVWILPVLPDNLMNLFPDQRRQRTFQVNADSETLSHSIMFIKLRTSSKSSLSFSIAYDLSSINADTGIPYAAFILIGLYILIIFEVVHRALAAMLASTMSIAMLAALNERPTMDELISWIDIDTLLLLFSMMVLVAIIAETGVFDWLAVYAYKITAGRLWPLIMALCFFTAFLSSLLDNVTTVLLMTPVTIRLCEVMELNPVPILTAMVVYSNIGGAMTPVGDPPNVIIASNRDVKNAEVDFGTFSLHMSIGVILVLIVVSAQVRYIFRDVTVLRFDEPQDVQELRHTIAIWQRAAASLSTYSKDENLVRETLLKKVQRLLSQLKKKLITGSAALEKYKTTLEELQEKFASFKPVSGLDRPGRRSAASDTGRQRGLRRPHGARRVEHLVVLRVAVHSHGGTLAFGPHLVDRQENRGFHSVGQRGVAISGCYFAAALGVGLRQLLRRQRAARHHDGEDRVESRPQPRARSAHAAPGVGADVRRLYGRKWNFDWSYCQRCLHGCRGTARLQIQFHAVLQGRISHHANEHHNDYGVSDDCPRRHRLERKVNKENVWMRDLFYVQGTMVLVLVNNVCYVIF
ncbi:PREDICTED: P protein isoform X1 [Vollenhovia emeryi]|uniref:P protein isoform X1 n=1 Tax=Vollenhovia emeryi TaxID=411798 RepID=UPI0005F3A084|nr:PREDICTED: P protein isoform X1 [Vollenhovia emeryi]